MKNLVSIDCQMWLLMLTQIRNVSIALRWYFANSAAASSLSIPNHGAGERMTVILIVHLSTLIAAGLFVRGMVQSKAPGAKCTRNTIYLHRWVCGIGDGSVCDFGSIREPWFDKHTAQWVDVLCYVFQQSQGCKRQAAETRFMLLVTRLLVLLGKALRIFDIERLQDFEPAFDDRVNQALHLSRQTG